MSDSNFTDTIKEYAIAVKDQATAAKDSFFETIAQNQADHLAAPQNEAELAIESVEHFYQHFYQ